MSATADGRVEAKTSSREEKRFTRCRPMTVAASDKAEIQERKQEAASEKEMNVKV